MLLVFGSSVAGGVTLLVGIMFKNDPDIAISFELLHSFKVALFVEKMEVSFRMEKDCSSLLFLIGKINSCTETYSTYQILCIIWKTQKTRSSKSES